MKIRHSSNTNMAIVTTMTMLAKVVAIVRQMVLTYFYGAGAISDAYLLAQSVPNTLFLLVSTAIGVSFTPVFTQVQEEKSEKEATLFANNIVCILIIIASVLTAITLMFSQQIVFIFANGFDADTAKMTASFLRISIFSIYFVGMAGVFSAYLKIKGNYLAPSIIGIALSIVEIVSCIVAAGVNDIFLPIGILAATFVQWIIVLGASRKQGFHFYPHINFQSKYVRRVVKMSLPIMIGLGVDEINVIIDRTIASTFSAGSISSLTYANTIVGVIHTVVSVSINSVVFVDVTKYAAVGDKRKVLDVILKGIEKAFLLLIPAAIGLMCYSEPIVKILYQRGSFDSAQTSVTAAIMVCYAIYIVPNGLRIISQSYFYAYGKTKFCMYAGLIGAFTNVIFNLCLSRWIGVTGLALATSLGVITSAIIIFGDFIIKNKGFPVKALGIYTTKICICTVIMIVPSLFIFNIMTGAKMNQILALFIAVTIAIIIYSICVVAIRIISMEEVKRMIKKLLMRK